MSSVVEGYNYDIFISYRQKDNKGDRWVSEFVEALKTELESTFKEEISVYFDINPHDGLLETHDVDESLKSKLKCLVFIPVISRTYCDPKSFAWQHEFVAFIEQVSGDRFGLKVKLPNGNVATRVLPVKIHELDPADQLLCETVLGGVPRGVDFIFKSSGVNRPLRMNEVNPKENLNHTYYRDQINKVANAIDEIISALKKPLQDIEPLRKETATVPDKIVNWKKTYLKYRYIKILAFVTLIALTGVIGYFLFRKSGPENNKMSIAFIPFQAPPNDYSLMNAGSNLVEAVSSKLNRIKNLEVIPRISTLQFRGTDLSLEKIMRKLKADYFIGGRVWNEDEKTKIYIEVSDSKNQNVLWSGDFLWTNENSREVTNDIVSILTGKLKVVLTPEETRNVFTELTNNAEARMNYLSGNSRTIDSRFYLSYDYQNDSAGFPEAINSYEKAISLEPQFAEAYIGRSIASSWGIYLKQLDTSYVRKSWEDILKASAIDSTLPELQIATAFYYYHCTNYLDSALFYFKRAAEINPFDYQPLFYQAMVYRRKGDWQSSRSLISKVARSNPREALFLTNIAMTYDYLHQFDSAMIYHQKAIDLMPGWRASYINEINSELQKGKTKNAWKTVNAALVNLRDSLIHERIMLKILERKYSDALDLALHATYSGHEKKYVRDVFYPAYERFIDLASAYAFLNNTPQARAGYDSAEVILEKLLLNLPESNDLHAKLAIVHAGLGDYSAAVKEAEAAIKLSGQNALDLADMKLVLAKVYTMTGDYGHALNSVEDLLSGPSMLSKKYLGLDPVWKPLLNVPDFEKMIKKY